MLAHSCSDCMVGQKQKKPPLCKSSWQPLQKRSLASDCYISIDRLGWLSFFLSANFHFPSFLQVCGQADVWGDGVVPEVSAHLEGALNISLDGVYHSPVGSDGTIRPWFGSASVLKKWVHHLLT